MTTSVFTGAEQTYLDSQPLGRLSTLAPTKPREYVRSASPTNHELDTIDIGGHNLAVSRKDRNVQADPRVSIIIDDLASIAPGDRAASRSVAPQKL